MGLDLDRAVPVSSQSELSITRLPERPPASVYQTLAFMVLHILLSALGSAALVALAVSGLFFTAAPKLISVLVEPFSLLLLPGLVLATLAAGLHDYSPQIAIRCSLAFYFVVIYTWLRRRFRRKHKPQPAGGTLSSASLDQ